MITDISKSGIYVNLATYGLVILIQSSIFQTSPILSTTFIWSELVMEFIGSASEWPSAKVEGLFNDY